MREYENRIHIPDAVPFVSEEKSDRKKEIFFGNFSISLT